MVSSVRLIPAQRCNWWKKRKDFAMCAALRKCGALIAHHTLSDLRQRAAQLVCDCSNKLALRKSD